MKTTTVEKRTGDGSENIESKLTNLIDSYLEEIEQLKTTIRHLEERQKAENRGFSRED